ncbi:hypothetical protein [Microlunatus parietis]|uniref:Uncharacterized protein n=1 Tax=Microlunatus parietis TaxID=682979 RepID=A0A7Y9I8P9_9ACTN|nr:hypothetical protein [Microlunatus parietis]NYE72252.1 hypothetical protein [Microlunatus parietis]
MSEQQSPPGIPGPPAVQAPRLDETPIASEWGPPEDEPDEQRRLPGPVRALIVVLVVAVLVGGVWALGGFKVRTDTDERVQPGQTIETGPYELAFSEATAQKHIDDDGTATWYVTVLGTARTTGDEALSPRNTMFVAKDPETVEQPDAGDAEIGTGDTGTHPANLTPGLPPVPYRVMFMFSEHYRPTDKILFAVYRLEEGNALLLDTGEKSWNNTRYVFRYDLPLTVLPEKKT